ncbi:hypothetical protein [Streptomyces sp. NPDC059063]|uniref:hypothetical protein n=1 Tax=Streptomyces sp. NPDC059063 TaxID=3346712 RepID=UPI0036C5E3CF
MTSLIGHVGPFGLAAIFTAILIFGTKEGGHVKPLSWGWCLILSTLAGASFAAAPWPFTLVRDLVNDLVKMINAVFPQLSLPAIGVIMIVIIMWRKLTRRGVSMMGIAWWYIASSADGGLGILADRIQLLSHHLAA